MIPSEAARRYAKAMFELANEAASLDVVVTEIAKLAAAYEGSAELQSTLDSPLVALDAKRAIVKEITEAMRLGPIPKQSAQLLLERRRIDLLPAISAALGELADKKRGLVRAEVISAVPLPDSYYERLKVQLERVTGKKITIDRRTDPSILGGVVTRIGDRIFDGSLQSRLSEVRQHLLPN